MSRVHSRWSHLVVVLGLVLTAGPARAWVVTPPRPGQVGFSLQGTYGTLLSTGGLGEGFDNGPGLGVHVRYRMRYERGIGLSFETMQFSARSGHLFEDPENPGRLLPADTLTTPDHLTMTLSGLDVYQMFGTRTPTTRMLSAGIGIAQIHENLKDGELQFLTPDGFYVSLGAGVEKFFFGSLAYDLSARYMTVFWNGSTNHQFQASAGLVFYASY
jgi:hypothetical protein